MSTKGGCGGEKASARRRRTIQYDIKKLEPAFLRQAREFLFFLHDVRGGKQVSAPLSTHPQLILPLYFSLVNTVSLLLLFLLLCRHRCRLLSVRSIGLSIPGAGDDQGVRVKVSHRFRRAILRPASPDRSSSYLFISVLSTNLPLPPPSQPPPPPPLQSCDWRHPTGS